MEYKQIFLLVLLVFAVFSLNKVRFLEEYLMPGEELEMYLNVVNNNNKDIDDVRIVAYLPDMGEEIRAANFDIQDNDNYGKFLWWNIPFDATQGDYLIKITASNDNHKSTTFRYITVE